ncbi:MAG: tol-pal system-associated acyl-CoA thioesterase [Nitrosomonadaceae bacterium]|nr:tol-pal system-associated acyl-CoA thioesterase [Nitrosomonadaceae bacterium]|tara:strand:- start:1186 stop:1617 length:432 start_codon:yes stop_codon:yes gene_type:complete
MEKNIKTKLKTKPIFILPTRVYYQDTDAGGVVYHSTYLNFMERARYEWMRGLDLDIKSLAQIHRVIFMIRSLNIEYFKPAILDDLLHVTVQNTELGKARITILQHVLRGQITLASATIQVVCVGADTLKLASLPISLRHKFGN